MQPHNRQCEVDTIKMYAVAPIGTLYKSENRCFNGIFDIFILQFECGCLFCSPFYFFIFFV